MTKTTTQQLAEARELMQALIIDCAPGWIRERQERLINQLKAEQMAEGGPDTTEDRIIAAYRQLAERPGQLVSLVRVRAELADIARAEQDWALKTLDRARTLYLEPNPNRKAITAEERAAAIQVGSEAKHLVRLV